MATFKEIEAESIKQPISNGGSVGITPLADIIRRRKTADSGGVRTIEGGAVSYPQQIDSRPYGPVWQGDRAIEADTEAEEVGRVPLKGPLAGRSLAAGRQTLVRVFEANESGPAMIYWRPAKPRYERKADGHLGAIED